jgi:3-oxoadipate enol-lactonase
VKVRATGTELSCETRGEGPAVLFLHAFPLAQAMWAPQVDALHSTHRLVTFDNRGFGGTPPGDGLLTMERIADDAAAVLDQLGISQAVLCGLSMGGYAAFAFVRRHADRLRGLVLADTRSGPDSAETRKNRALLAERVQREGSPAAAEASLPKLLGETSHRERPDAVARVRDMIIANPRRGIADALAGLAARADSTPTLREIRVPTLVLCGTEDRLTPPSEAEALARGVAGSRLELIPRAGHLSSFENPAAFNDVLRGFLTEIG